MREVTRVAVYCVRVYANLSCLRYKAVDASEEVTSLRGVENTHYWPTT